MKAATIKDDAALEYITISIHAAREGGDKVKGNMFYINDISIHAAREGGDVQINGVTVLNGISIHAAREGGDLANMIGNSDFRYFNPRRP